MQWGMNLTEIREGLPGEEVFRLRAERRVELATKRRLGRESE